MQHRRKLAHALSAAVAAVPALVFTSPTRAATDTFDPTAPLTGTLVFPYPGTSTSVTYYALDNTTANFTQDGGATTTTYTQGDAVIFNGNAGGLLAGQSSFYSTTDPASLTFSGGTSSTTWTFLRASTATSGSSNSAGFYSTTNEYTNNGTGGTNPLYPSGAGADSFGSASPFSTAGAVNILLDSTFSGKVIFRARPSGASTGTVEIDGGTLEIDDSEALPGKSNPTINLGGGTFALNINNGRYATGDANTNPGSGDLRTVSGSINVTQNSGFANDQVDDNGNSRFLSSAWGGSINITAGKTLTFATGSEYISINPQSTTTSVSQGAITTVGTGYSTISLGTSPGVLRIAGAGTASGTSAAAQPYGNPTTDFNAGTSTGAFLANNSYTAAAAIPFYMGGLSGGSGTFLLGGTGGGQAAGGLDNYSVGYLNLNETFAGKITNGAGSGASTRIVSFTKVGTGTQTLADNYFSGPITINASSGTIQASSTRTLTDSNATVTINAGSTIDLNGNSPNAGKAITLAGGSLVNNGASAVTLGTGTSASLTSGTTAGGTYTAFAGTSLAGPTVTIAGGGGSGANPTALLNIVSVGNPTNRGGYAVAPIVTVSAPNLPGGRQAIVNALLDKSTGALAFQLADPGFGYTSSPTITVSGGTLLSGSTVADPSTAVITMAVDSVYLASAGSGYTSAPTLAFTTAVTTSGGGSGQVGGTTQAVGTAGFAAITLTASSSIGGTGPLTVSSPIGGASGFALTKVGTGTTALSAANTYVAGTTLSAGTLQANNATSSLGTGLAAVGAAGTLAGGTKATPGATGSGGVSLAGGTITAGVGAASGNAIGTLIIGSSASTPSGLAQTVSSAYAAKIDGSQTLTATGQSAASGTGTVYTGAADELILSALTLAGGTTLTINPVVNTTGSLTVGTKYDLVIADGTGSATTFSSVASQLSLSTTSNASGTYALDYAPDGAGGQDLLLDFTPATVGAPEPTSLLLAGIAAAPLALGRRRRRVVGR